MKTFIAAVLAVAAAASLAGRAEAYSHSILNKAGTKVHVRVKYVLCSTDTFDIKPGETVTFRSGGCCINFVQHYNESNYVWENGKAVPARWDTDFGMLCKNTNIVIQQTVAGLR